jgi:hypothetical protein
MRGKGYQTSQGMGNMYLKFMVYNDTNIDKEKLEKLRKVYSEE